MQGVGQTSDGNAEKPTGGSRAAQVLATREAVTRLEDHSGGAGLREPRGGGHLVASGARKERQPLLETCSHGERGREIL